MTQKTSTVTIVLSWQFDPLNIGQIQSTLGVSRLFRNREARIQSGGICGFASCDAFQRHGPKTSMTSKHPNFGGHQSGGKPGFFEPLKKNKLLLSIESWLFNKDPYFMGL